MRRLAAAAAAIPILVGCGNSSPPIESVPSAQACQTSDFSYSVGATEGAAGTSYITLLIRNVSERTCTLEGTPIAQAVVGSAKDPLGPAARENPMSSRGGTVELSPSQVTSVIYGEATATNYPAEDCKPQTADGVLITFQANGVSAFFPLPKYEVCTATVSTFISGVAEVS